MANFIHSQHHHQSNNTDDFDQQSSPPPLPLLSSPPSASNNLEQTPYSSSSSALPIPLPPPPPIPSSHHHNQHSTPLPIDNNNSNHFLALHDHFGHDHTSLLDMYVQEDRLSFASFSQPPTTTGAAGVGVGVGGAGMSPTRPTTPVPSPSSSALTPQQQQQKQKQSGSPLPSSSSRSQSQSQSHSQHQFQSQQQSLHQNNNNNKSIIILLDPHPPASSPSIPSAKNPSVASAASSASASTNPPPSSNQQPQPSTLQSRLWRVFSVFLSDVFGAACYAPRLTVLTVDDRRDGQPHVTVLVDSICIHDQRALHVARTRLCSSLVCTPGLQRPHLQGYAKALLGLLQSHARHQDGRGGRGESWVAHVFTAPVVANALRKHIRHEQQMQMQMQQQQYEITGAGGGGGKMNQMNAKSPLSMMMGGSSMGMYDKNVIMTEIGRVGNNNISSSNSNGGVGIGFNNTHVDTTVWVPSSMASDALMNALKQIIVPAFTRPVNLILKQTHILTPSSRDDLHLNNNPVVGSTNIDVDSKGFTPPRSYLTWSLSMYPRFIPAGGDVGCTTIFNSTSSNSHTSPVATTLPQQQHHVTTLRVDRVVAASSVSEDVLYGVPYMLYDANDGGTVVVQKQQHGQPSTHANDTSHKVRGLSRKNIPQSTPAVADASLSETAAAQSSFTALTHELVARDAVLLCLVIGNVNDSEAEYHKTWCIITPSPVKPGCAMLRHIAINCTLLPSPPPPQPPSPSPAQQNGKSGNNEDVQTKKDGNPQQQQQQYGNTLAASDQQQQNEQLLLPSSLSPLPLTLTPPVLDDWETVPLSQPFSEHTNISSGIITNTAQPTTTTIPNNKSPTSVAKSSTTQRRRHNSKDFSRDRGSSRRDADSHNNGEYNNKKMVATDVSVVDLESDGRRRIDALEKYVANSQERRVRFDVPTGSQQQQPQR